MPAHPQPTGVYSPGPAAVATDSAVPTIVFAIPPANRQQYSGNPYTRLFVHTTLDAVRALGQHVPWLVVVDWDDGSIDGAELCRVATGLPNTSILVTTRDVAQASAAIKAGAHALLLKPFAPSLLAARIGRTLRETMMVRGRRQPGLNRVWPQLTCPSCAAPGAVSFDFSSHRRMWLACLACDHAWLGPRLE